MTILKKPKYQFVVFLLIFLIINLLQSNYTALFEDEAYYWVWSKNLAFGYFDHPPLVAIWIKIGTFFFDGELGLRFFSTISFSIMLVIIWLTIDHKEKWNYVWLYFLLISSVALLQVFGFVTTPDTPLFLFAAIFLYAYKQFLKDNNWFNTLILGFAMAGLLYSKYHGILIIIFALLSNLKLLKNSKFWFASIFGFLLFLPHLYWQYINDYPTFIYHLKERNSRAYKFEYTLMHFVNQIVIVGITFPIIYKAFYKQQITSLFDRSLKFIVYGFIIFFFFGSFKTRTQAQWTGLILIPLVILTFQYFIQHQNARKWLIRLGTAQLVIIVIARLFLANENISPVKLEPHIAKTWIPQLKEKTNSKPIVFVDSYQNASLYNFYTGIKTHSYSILKSRKSQYDLIDFEDNMQDKNLYTASKRLKEAPFLVIRKRDSLNGFPIQNYNTFQKVKCIIENDKMMMNEGEKLNFQFKFINTYPKNINFDHVKFIGVFQGHKNKILTKVPIHIYNLKSLYADEEIVFNATITVPKLNKSENISFRVALEFYDMLEGYQGNKISIAYIYKSTAQ
ncbi:MAG: glycosyltransferase family 39 protein [Flavobacteriaceae bacterium]|nr:glycosyltransferase family 39 protein [Flavobacteriaceae bacterium]